MNRVELSKKLIVGTLLIFAHLGCNEGKFASGTRKRPSSNAVETPKTPPGTTPPGTTPPQCTDKTQVTGAHLLFILDNSGSMRDTDCPNRNSHGCGSETNRENAVLAAYDALSGVWNQTKTQSAISSMSIAQFTPGYSKGSPNLIGMETKGDQLEHLRRQLTFLRNPSGDTPYQDGTALAKDLLNKLNSKFGNDGKPRVVVMVTDGEPTDRAPNAALQEAQAIRSTGAQWITVMVVNGQLKQQRIDEHRRLMGQYDYERGRRYPNGHWYDASYTNFDTYFNDIISLPQKMSNRVIEVNFATELRNVIVNEIVAKKVECK